MRSPRSGLAHCGARRSDVSPIASTHRWMPSASDASEKHSVRDAARELDAVAAKARSAMRR